MSEKHLLLSSAKSGVLVAHNRSEKRWLIAASVIGVFVVLVGAADATSRLSHAFLGADAARLAFAPALLAVNPSPAVVATTTAFVPTHLTVASIGVDATVEQVGKKPDGSMATPSKFSTVGWYSLGSKPGEAGNAVIDGHVNNALTTAGVFEHLSNVKLGDEIKVADSSGKTLAYSVTSIQEYAASTAPAASIFATSGPSQLVLITCDGDWVASDHSFNKRLVVFASPK